MQTYARRFSDHSLLVPKYVATDALRVGHFRQGLRDDIRLMYKSLSL